MNYELVEKGVVKVEMGQREEERGILAGCFVLDLCVAHSWGCLECIL